MSQPPFLSSGFGDCAALTFSTEGVKPTLDHVAYGKATYIQISGLDLKRRF